jgi:hypothetical protein
MLKDFQQSDKYSLPTKYFMLRSVLETAKREGINTPIIRGREDKAAFKRAMQTAMEMYKSISGQEEVKEAIAWAKQETARQREEKKRDIEERLSQIESDLSRLESNKVSVSFIDWYQDKIANPLHGKIPIPKWIILLDYGMYHAWDSCGYIPRTISWL